MPRTQAQFKFIQGRSYSNGAKTALFRMAYSDTEVKELLMVASPHQKFLVDWQSIYLVKENNDLKSLGTLSSKPKVFKMYLTRGNLYNADYPSEEYQSLRVRDYSNSFSTTAYVKIGSLTSALLAQAFMSSNLKLEGELATRIEAKMQRKGSDLEIIEILSSDWSDLSTFMPQEPSL